MMTTGRRKYPIIGRPAEMRIDNAYILDKDRFYIDTKNSILSA